MSTPNILTQIWNGAVKDFDAAETWIEGEVAKVEAVLPGAAPIVADLKQAASDAVGTVDQALITYEPPLVSGLETILDAAMTKYSGGLALPLVPGVNSGITGIATTATQAISAWLLKVQAQLAENTATAGAQTTAAPAQPAT